MQLMLSRGEGDDLLLIREPHAYIYNAITILIAYVFRLWQLVI